MALDTDFEEVVAECRYLEGRVADLEAERADVRQSVLDALVFLRRLEEHAGEFRLPGSLVRVSYNANYHREALEFALQGRRCGCCGGLLPESSKVVRVADLAYCSKDCQVSDGWEG